MTVLVTGGSGKLGRSVVRHLAEHGYDVVNADLASPPGDAPGRFLRVDLEDVGQVLELVSRVDEHDRIEAVVHLAAIPAPGLRPDSATFRLNTLSTYAVFDAASRSGIDRVVWASSETLLGLPFDVPPPYIPVDEDYPAAPNSAYSLTKLLGEAMAGQYVRRFPSMSIVGLRFSNVMDPADYALFPGYDADATARKWNLWGYIDGRDGAQAVRRALEADLQGAENFIIAAADTVMSRSDDELVAEVFPGVAYTSPGGPNDTLLSIEKARRLLGYEPEHSWRTEVAAAGEG